MKFVFIKEDIIRRLLYSIKDPNVLKRLGTMAFTFAKNIEKGR